MIKSSLLSDDRVQRIYPKGHPLYPLVVPTFDTVRCSLDRLCISAIWIDADLEPSRAGFRPSYDGLLGAGSNTMMPFIGSWMSTGPPVDDRGNVVIFLESMDRTIVEYAERLGLVGEYRFAGTLEQIKNTIKDVNHKIYSIDDLGEDFDDRSVISSKLSAWLNSKDDLSTISSYSPCELVKDMHQVTLDDYHAIKRDGHRVYVKTCNTETAGMGVFICNNQDEFSRHLDNIRENQARYDLNRTLVIQRELLGTNRSFNLLMDPQKPDEIQVVALTDQLVEPDGKTYKSSVNYPINAKNLERVGPVIMDMIGKIWERHPEAFGYLMCDFFENDKGEIVIYDPGIRPTGNTAPAMASLLGQKLTGQSLYVSNFTLKTGVKGLSFADLCKKADPLFSLEHIISNKTGLMPWGWNKVGGSGILIGLAPDQGAFNKMVAHMNALDYKSP